MVRRGEMNIFLSGRGRRNVQLNLIYELAVLKPYIEPLLAESRPIRRDSEAERLLRFLGYFLPFCRAGDSLLRSLSGKLFFPTE